MTRVARCPGKNGQWLGFAEFPARKRVLGFLGEGFGFGGQGLGSHYEGPGAVGEGLGFGFRVQRLPPTTLYYTLNTHD